MQDPEESLIIRATSRIRCARAATYCSLGCPVSPTSTIKIQTILNLHPAEGSKL